MKVGIVAAIRRRSKAKIKVLDVENSLDCSDVRR